MSRWCGLVRVEEIRIETNKEIEDIAKSYRGSQSEVVAAGMVSTCGTYG